MIKIGKKNIKKEVKIDLTKKEKNHLKGINYIVCGKFGEKLGFENKPVCNDGFWFDLSAGLKLPKILPDKYFSFLNEKRNFINVKKELNFI